MKLFNKKKTELLNEDKVIKEMATGKKSEFVWSNLFSVYPETNDRSEVMKYVRSMTRS